ncbi:hypothetical protein PPACK8108_LOCUS13369 [Phakopsora pachyrhizi]|uniref:Uncharacterized protein n=1 Tax=Phakopsora pachyrhizi TaxID=170000 RepID=A0AAV0B705_PHAPC|nr:hypothetical protein PPACK8108_LOCUS13369 [Phakopsora pachyrhizi]
MTIVLSVTLAVGAQQFAKYKAIVTQITAIEELAGVTILCSDKTGTLTTNKSTVKTYSDVSADDVCLLASCASQTKNQDAIDSCIVGMVGTIAAQRGISLIDFKPFDPVIKRTEITYNNVAMGEMHPEDVSNKNAEVSDSKFFGLGGLGGWGYWGGGRFAGLGGYLWLNPWMGNAYGFGLYHRLYGGWLKLADGHQECQSIQELHNLMSRADHTVSCKNMNGEVAHFETKSCLR